MSTKGLMCVFYWLRRDSEEVLVVAEEIARRGAAMTQDVLAGRPIYEVMGASYERMLEH